MPYRSREKLGTFNHLDEYRFPPISGIFFMTEASKAPKTPKTPKVPNPTNIDTDTEVAVESPASDVGTESAEAPAKAAPAAKKEKAPALEDKPFADFVQQDFVPAIQSGLTAQGLADLQLEFAKAPVKIAGVPNIPECWQIVGKWKNNTRQFNLYFFAEDIQGQRGFSCISNGGTASSIEPFLIDERKMTLDLLLFGLTKRLNAQKWLLPN
jgi:Protein of unknown function (DUF2996)